MFQILFIAKTFRSGYLFMDKCDFLVANLFIYIRCTEDIQYYIEINLFNHSVLQHMFGI